MSDKNVLVVDQDIFNCLFLFISVSNVSVQSNCSRISVRDSLLSFGLSFSRSLSSINSEDPCLYWVGILEFARILWYREPEGDDVLVLGFIRSEKFA